VLRGHGCQSAEWETRQKQAGPENVPVSGEDAGIWWNRCWIMWGQETHWASSYRCFIWCLLLFMLYQQMTTQHAPNHIILNNTLKILGNPTQAPPTHYPLQICPPQCWNLIDASACSHAWERRRRYNHLTSLFTRWFNSSMPCIPRILSPLLDFPAVNPLLKYTYHFVINYSSGLEIL